MPAPIERQNANEDFSPLLMAGMLIRPLPLAPLNRLLQHVARRIQNNHPAILDRLRPLTGTTFLIRPTDMPHAIRMTVGDGHMDCHIEDEFLAPADVTITGPLLSLIDMMDGKLDGDALFFSRSLTVEGDTEALLTLRNAIDSDDIDLRAEILAAFGPLEKPAAAVLKIGDQLYQRLSHNMNMISTAITRPLSTQLDGLEQENHVLRDKIRQLDKMLTKTQNRLQSLTRKAGI
ncbi:hypothetical protein MNBD_ALPHA01-1506 [hydrothermal vent metagenome]|uniref:SCP2 domain-containing protein n=1 Tax=hydrothermal vent metagenome TaxID=652676 RepID=A0A3B0T445_9ZZZZ